MKALFFVAGIAFGIVVWVGYVLVLRYFPDTCSVPKPKATPPTPALRTVVSIGAQNGRTQYGFYHYIGARGERAILLEFNDGGTWRYVENEDFILEGRVQRECLQVAGTNAYDLYMIHSRKGAISFIRKYPNIDVLFAKVDSLIREDDREADAIIKQ